MIWKPDEEWEKKSQEYYKKRNIEYEQLKTEKEINNCAKLIDQKLNEGKQYFLGVLKKKNTIYANDVEDYLKESGGKFREELYPKNHPFYERYWNPQTGKISDLQSQPLKDFGVRFYNVKLKYFLFHLKTKNLPKKFSLEISGNDYYSGFQAEYFSDENKFRVKVSEYPWPFSGLEGDLTKKLNDELVKIPRYQDDPIPF